MVADLKRGDIREVVEAIADEVSPIQARLARAVISSIFSFAGDRELIDTIPARNIKLGEKYKPRVRAYSEDELRRFWHALMSDPSVDDSVTALKILFWCSQARECRRWSVPKNATCS